MHITAAGKLCMVGDGKMGDTVKVLLRDTSGGDGKYVVSRSCMGPAVPREKYLSVAPHGWGRGEVSASGIFHLPICESPPPPKLPKLRRYGEHILLYASRAGELPINSNSIITSTQRPFRHPNLQRRRSSWYVVPSPIPPLCRH